MKRTEDVLELDGDPGPPVAHLAVRIGPGALAEQEDGDVLKRRLDQPARLDTRLQVGVGLLDEVVERAALFENEAVLMTHFSARYKAREVVAALDARLPSGLRERVTPLLFGFA